MMSDAGFKVSILKKLRSTPQVKVVGYLTQPSRVLQLHHHRHHASSSSNDGSGSPSLPLLSSRPCRLRHDQPPLSPDPAGRALRELPVGRAAQNGGQVQEDERRLHPLCKILPPLPPTAAEPDIIDVAEHISDFKDDDIWSFEDGEESTQPMPTSPAADHIHVITPSLPSSPEKPFLPDKRRPRGPASAQLDDLPSYRRPNFNSCSLFDPDLLAAFEAAVMQYNRACDELRRKPLSPADQAAAAQLREEGEREQEEDGDEEEEETPCKVPRRTDNVDEEEEGCDVEPGDVADPLRGFEVRYSPGGGGAVVLYTTSLRGIRKTFEDCNRVRFLLRGLRVVFHERDVSMHLGYREELWRILGGRAIPPRLFIKGRHVGGADEVLGLHEQGRLLPLVRGIPSDLSGGLPCGRCGGVGFLVCAECSGSRNMYEVGMNGGGEAVRCPHCNENGLVVCTLCCCCCCSSCCPAGHLPAGAD